MSFLTAEWRKLAIANYEVDPGLLKKYIPPKTEIDLWHGTCYVSLVGFMFLNTKLLGIPIPFHRNFEEVNLRFYVRHFHKGEWKRGVVFIKEIVPKPALTFVANTIYKEHYQTLSMSHVWSESEKGRTVEYRWKMKPVENSFGIKAAREAKPIDNNSETEFITEHYWGYTKAKSDASFEYEVTHPRWEAYEVFEHTIHVDFAMVYGKEFEHLSREVPKSVMLAEGSEITVENKRTL